MGFSMTVRRFVGGYKHHVEDGSIQNGPIYSDYNHWGVIQRIVLWENVGDVERERKREEEIQ